MDASIATGGFFFLVIIVLLIAGVIGMWALASSGYKATEQRAHDKAIRRSVLQGYQDENTRQNHARKLLNDYDQK